MRNHHFGVSGLVLAVFSFCGSESAWAESDGCRLVLCLGAPNPGGIGECAGVYKDFLKGDLAPICKAAETGGDGEITSSRTVEYTACPAAYPVPSTPPASQGDNPSSSGALSMCRSTTVHQECTGSGGDKVCELVHRYVKRPTHTVFRAYQDGHPVAEIPLN